MTMEPQETSPNGLSRRAFIKSSAVTAAALASQGLTGVYAAGSDRLRIGLIGCGGRGSGAALNALESSPNVELVALGDLFQDRLDDFRRGLARQGDKVKLSDDRCFVGFDAYRKVIGSGVDLVILATPPGFRPIHLKAAVEAGKHVFMEKPVAVDPTGVRSVIASSDLAAQKKLAIVAGTQRRHQASYVETIKRIHDGAAGDIVAAQCYWNQGGLWMRPRQSNWSDTEWQIRNWLYFTWLSGDHIVEQHVHNLDVINWVFNTHPVRAVGMGGRQVRTDPAYGHIYDHFTIDFEYPNGAHLMSMCRQIDGTAGNVSEHVVGTLGTADPGGSIQGKNAWRFEGDQRNPYVQEHADLIASIRAGKPLNEGRRIAESTLTAIMGRMSAYTGQEITWDQTLNSKLDTMPKELAMGPLPVPPVAMPGTTPFV
jgi:myo-inositol 2-dehydrogenase / D-chiro-inositol 1-dehydrogenase